ncbi:MAG: Short chain dehydrogenase [Planctomycetota bacterium]|jgi:3-dehydrosphinganine reductase
MDFFSGKRALVVGGSRGIGRALARLLARRGARVCVAARRAGDLDRVVAELAPVTAGPHARAVFDVTDAAAVAMARPGVLSSLGGIDVLACVSGFAHAGGVFHTPVEDFRRMLEVNYLGNVNVVHSFGPELVTQRNGTICFISSLAALVPIYGYAAYAASKAAVAAFAEALRQELKLHGVRVVVHYPPPTDTPGLAEENRTKPSAVWAIETLGGWNKVHTAETVASSIATAIERGRPQCLTGYESRFLSTFNRLAPGFFRRLTDAEVRKAVGSG